MYRKETMKKLNAMTASEENEYKNDSKVITLDDIIGENTAFNRPKNEEKKEQQEDRTITPSGMREIKLEDVENGKKVKYIENPLPVPKRREHRKMDYAVELTSANDDYDIKDMTGMDFFDIE